MYETNRRNFNIKPHYNEYHCHRFYKYDISHIITTTIIILIYVMIFYTISLKI